MVPGKAAEPLVFTRTATIGTNDHRWDRADAAATEALSLDGTVSNSAGTSTSSADSSINYLAASPAGSADIARHH
jgi:hypothetical protein